MKQETVRFDAAEIGGQREHDDQTERARRVELAFSLHLHPHGRCYLIQKGG